MIKNAVIDDNVSVGDGCSITNEKGVVEADCTEQGYVIQDGIVCVLRNAVIPPTQSFDSGCELMPTIRCAATAPNLHIRCMGPSGPSMLIAHTAAEKSSSNRIVIMPPQS